MKTQMLLETKLNAGLEPVYLEVVNESHQHNVPEGSESHFKVTIVSTAFESKNALARHRDVYRILAAELESKLIHALAVHTFTPAEWENVVQSLSSPPCRGGE